MHLHKRVTAFGSLPHGCSAAAAPVRVAREPPKLNSPTTPRAAASSGSCSSSSSGGVSNSAGTSTSQGSHQQLTRRAALQLALGAAASGAWQGSLSLQPAAAAAAEEEACQLTTLPNGLKYCDLKVGDGPVEPNGAFVKTHYTAKLASNGVVFDSSYPKKQPLIWKLGSREVIEAWDVALLGAEGMPPMQEGGVRRLVVPPGQLQRQGTKSLVWVVGLSEALEDAGELSPTGTPTSDLIFDVELVPKRRR